jgi:hypothetical protein
VDVGRRQLGKVVLPDPVVRLRLPSTQYHRGMAQANAEREYVSTPATSFGV